MFIFFFILPSRAKIHYYFILNMSRSQYFIFPEAQSSYYYDKK